MRYIRQIFNEILIFIKNFEKNEKKRGKKTRVYKEKTKYEKNRLK